MSAPTGSSSPLRVLDHPLVRVLVTRLRDRATGTAEFRRVVRRLAALLTVEATRDLELVPGAVATPYEGTTGYDLARPVTVVPILRAGLGMCDGVLDVLPDAAVGHVGVRRDEASLEPLPYYAKFPPPIAQGTVLLVDPMLATGGSADHAATLLAGRGCREVTFLCLVAAPEGVARLAARHPQVRILAAALDRGLDAAGRIRPGLGDAGDRLFATEGA